MRLGELYSKCGRYGEEKILSLPIGNRTLDLQSLCQLKFPVHSVYPLHYKHFTFLQCPVLGQGGTV
jgi:hypothetical protein